MYASSIMFPGFSYGLKHGWVVSLFVCILGLTIIGISGMQFRQASTTVNPLTPDKTNTLVVTGIYAYSRNPMYVGFFLFLVSVEILIANFVALIFLPLFIVVINRLQIQPEEKALERMFGDEYRQYLKDVRRWI